MLRLSSSHPLATSAYDFWHKKKPIPEREGRSNKACQKCLFICIIMSSQAFVKVAFFTFLILSGEFMT